MERVRRTVKRLARIRKFFLSCGLCYDIGNLDLDQLKQDDCMCPSDSDDDTYQSGQVSGLNPIAVEIRRSQIYIEKLLEFLRAEAFLRKKIVKKIASGTHLQKDRM